MGEGEVEQVLEHVADDPVNQLDPAASGEPAEDVPVVDEVTPRRGGGCRTERRGWAGGHSHGAVRPRRRPVGRGRPPGRWC